MPPVYAGQALLGGPPYAKAMQTRGEKACFQFPECSLPYAKAMQTRGEKACFQFPECSLPYAKIRQKIGHTKACGDFVRHFGHINQSGHRLK